MDAKIGNRSRTTSKSQLLRLIESYRSYPQYRNKKTSDNLYNRIINNKSVDMPIILKIDNSLTVMSGNTRMDITYQLGTLSKAIVIEV